MDEIDYPSDFPNEDAEHSSTCGPASLATVVVKLIECLPKIVIAYHIYSVDTLATAQHGVMRKRSGLADLLT